MSINFKKGDLFILEQVLVTENNDLMDIGGVDTIYISVRRDGDPTPLFKGACLFDVETSRVYYEFKDGETDTPGMYRIEYELRFPKSFDGTETHRTITIPNRGTLWMHIEEDVG